MSKKPFFLLGIIVLLITTAYGSSLLITSLRARSADDRNIESGGGGGGPHKNLCEPDVFEIAELSPSTRVISDVDSVAITAVLSNKGKEECDVILSLTAPNFSVDPEQETLVVLRPGLETETFVWILLPQKQGSFQLKVTAALSGSVIMNHLVGLTVTNVLGLTPRWAKVISILGSFFGPSLTLPTLIGWYKELKEKRGKRNQKKKKG
jgi:hypothetical protein